MMMHGLSVFLCHLWHHRRRGDKPVSLYPLSGRMTGAPNLALSYALRAPALTIKLASVQVHPDYHISTCEAGTDL